MLGVEARGSFVLRGVSTIDLVVVTPMPSTAAVGNVVGKVVASSAWVVRFRRELGVKIFASPTENMLIFAALVFMVARVPANFSR